MRERSPSHSIPWYCTGNAFYPLTSLHSQALVVQALEWQKQFFGLFLELRIGGVRKIEIISTNGAVNINNFICSYHNKVINDRK